MKHHLNSDLKRMGSKEIIELSQFLFKVNPNLLAKSAYFWSKSANALVLPCGLMAPTLLDVIH